jgi:hypothetical protein
MTDFLTWPVLHLVSIANFFLLLWNIGITLNLVQKLAAAQVTMAQLAQEVKDQKAFFIDWNQRLENKIDRFEAKERRRTPRV